MNVIIKYGHKIVEVANKIQSEVKNAIETMTGLKVVEVNVYVNAVYFVPETKPEEIDTAVVENEPIQEPTEETEEK